MNILSRSGTDFFLTGGTALSRAYYNHRYSDDLDLFLDNSPTYNEQVNKVLALLDESGFIWSTRENFVRAEDFATITIRHKDSETPLKLDFVNDKVPHFGNIQKTALFYRTDPIRNILSNKLSAIFRYEAKDVADIREIANRETVNWTEAIAEAQEKEAGLNTTYLCEILKGIPQSKFESVAWTKPQNWDAFRADIDRIVREILEN
jgi:predicted nucleotidyltransferase component of viral defense system